MIYHRKEKSLASEETRLFIFGAPGAIRTPDPLVRSQILYPTELRAPRFVALQQKQHYNTILSFVAVQIHIKQPIYQKTIPARSKVFGGERGIRTLDTGLSPYASLAGKCLRPLGQLTLLKQSSPNKNQHSLRCFLCSIATASKGAILRENPSEINVKNKNVLFLYSSDAIMRFLNRTLYAARVPPAPYISLRSPRRF